MLTSEQLTDLLDKEGLTLANNAYVMTSNIKGQAEDSEWSWSPRDPNNDTLVFHGRKLWTKTVFMMLGSYASRLYTDGSERIERIFPYKAKFTIDSRADLHMAETLEEQYLGPILLACNSVTDMAEIYFVKEADAIQFTMMVYAKGVPYFREYEKEMYRHGILR